MFTKETPLSDTTEARGTATSSRADIIKEWPQFDQALAGAAVSDALVQKFASVKSPLEIKMFIGTWCGDTRRELPALLKAIEDAKNAQISYSFILMDHSKNSASGQEKVYEVSRLPSFIFIQNGKELGRFVESSQGQSSNELLLQILNKAA